MSESRPIADNISFEKAAFVEYSPSLIPVIV